MRDNASRAAAALDLRTADIHAIAGNKGRVDFLVVNGSQLEQVVGGGIRC